METEWPQGGWSDLTLHAGEMGRAPPRAEGLGLEGHVRRRRKPLGRRNRAQPLVLQFGTGRSHRGRLRGARGGRYHGGRRHGRGGGQQRSADGVNRGRGSRKGGKGSRRVGKQGGRRGRESDSLRSGDPLLDAQVGLTSAFGGVLRAIRLGVALGFGGAAETLAVAVKLFLAA